ncbi:MAG: hypothetical protein HC896_13760 [Bacteroidales bacterium]|nr:hypothetical protein [Bacteroidales bacterium]
MQSQAKNPKIDVGAFAGGGNYYGDYNPGNMLYKPSLALGIMARLNINPRYAVRVNVYTSNLKGVRPGYLPDSFDEAFATRVVDVASQFEFNFMPLSPLTTKYSSKKRIGLSYATYVAGGLGFGSAFFNKTDFNGVTIPLSIGAKFNFSEKLGGGLEYSLRKTFSDKVDGVNFEENIGLGTHPVLHNNDWYNFFGVFITYKFVKFAPDCAVYD